MLKYILKRLLLIIPVVIGITLFIYLLLDIGMGDPTALILGPDASAEQVAALRAELGLDKSVFVRYFNYMYNAIQGDLGNSWYNSRPVIDEFLLRLPNTLALAFSALGITMVSRTHLRYPGCCPSEPADRRHHAHLCPALREHAELLVWPHTADNLLSRAPVAAPDGLRNI